MTNRLLSGGIILSSLLVIALPQPYQQVAAFCIVGFAVAKLVID